MLIALVNGTRNSARPPSQIVELLSAIELRVIGSLLEKAVTTPDQYPLTLNAIVTACNQKSSREPVTNYTQEEIQGALRTLDDKLLVSLDPNLRGRVEKYLQRFCKPPFGVYEFNEAQYAVITVLILRGPATPGELRTRTDRMHKFQDNNAVLATLTELRDWQPDALVAELPRESGRRDNRWVQLCSQETDHNTIRPGVTKKRINSEETVHEGAFAGEINDTGDWNDQQRLVALEHRVGELEDALAKVQKALGELGD